MRHPNTVALVTPDARGHWGTICRHGTRETWPSKHVAQIGCQHPADWCETCRIAALLDALTAGSRAGRRAS